MKKTDSPRLKILFLTCALAALYLFAAAQPLFSENIISYFEGAVRITRNGDTIPADFGMEVSAGDYFSTGPDGTAVISLAVGTEIKLRENTDFLLEDTGLETRVRLDSGGAFARITKLAGVRGGSFSMGARTVVAGVRGTEFFMAYGRTVEEAPDIWLCVNTGEVEVRAGPSGESMLVREGEGINILAARRMTPARRYRWTLELNWNMDPESGPVADQTDLDAAYSDLLDQDYD